MEEFKVGYYYEYIEKRLILRYIEKKNYGFCFENLNNQKTDWFGEIESKKIKELRITSIDSNESSRKGISFFYEFLDNKGLVLIPSDEGLLLIPKQEFVAFESGFSENQRKIYSNVLKQLNLSLKEDEPEGKIIAEKISKIISNYKLPDNVNVFFNAIAELNNDLTAEMKDDFIIEQIKFK